MPLSSLLKSFVPILVLFTPLAAIGAESSPQEQVERAVAQYEKAWGEPDAAKRAEYLADAWAQDATYRDPTVNLRGVAALSAHIGKFQADFPTLQGGRNSRIDLSGTSFRFSWSMQVPGSPPMEGIDVGELAPDGRIASITGFFGPLIKTKLSASEAVAAHYLQLLFEKFDLVEMGRIVAADAIYTQATGLPYGGRYVGLPEWTRMFAKAQTYFGIEVGAPNFFSTKEGEQIIAHFSATFHSRKTNRAMTLPIAELFTFKDGKISSITPFYFDTKTFVDFLNEDAAGTQAK